MSHLRRKNTKTDPDEGRLKRRDNWNAAGDLGLDPGPEKFVLQMTSKTVGKSEYSLWVELKNKIIRAQNSSRLLNGNTGNPRDNGAAPSKF